MAYFVADWAITTILLHKGTTILHIVISFNNIPIPSLLPPTPRYNVRKLIKSK
jgi:hypothetical protein